MAVMILARQRTKPIVIPDSIPDELKEAILNSKYPHVARVADPLLVRVDQLSLMVADVVYHARIKLGLGGKGFYIYASGLGTAVYENMFMHDKNDVKFNAEFGVSSNDTDENILSKIAEKAEDWLDVLEVAIASKQSDNPIKKAIDRLCWQLHYDITESHANFPVMFKSDDFSDVKIDRYPLDTEWWDGYTLKSTISDAAGVVRENDQPSSHTIIEKGYFSDSAQNLKDLDAHLTVDAFKSHVDEATGKTIIDQGALKLIQDNIVNFDNHMTAGAWSSTVVDGVDTVNNGALNKIATKLVPDGNDYYSISECLRDKQTINGTTTFSIARSLRESGQDSVSQATHDQTELERDEFDDIENRLGLPTGSNTIWNTVSSIDENVGDSNGRSVIDRIGYTSIGTNTLFGELDSVYTNYVTGSGGDQGDHSKIGSIMSNIGTPSDVAGASSLFGRIGTSSRTLTDGVTPSTILAETDAMYTAMFGRTGSYGFVGGPTDGPDSTFYTKSRTSDKDYRWTDY